MIHRHLLLFVLLSMFSSLLPAVDFSALAEGVDARQIALLHKAKIFGPDYQEPRDCIRGEPMPVLSAKMTAVADHYYEAISTVNSIETAVFADGSSVTAVHGGCEYYTITLFYTFAHTGQSLEQAKAYTLASGLLTRLHGLGVDTVFDFPLASRTLAMAARNELTEPCVLGCAVDGDGTDFLQSRVDVEAYGVMNNAREQYIEIGFNKGPL